MTPEQGNEKVDGGIETPAQALARIRGKIGEFKNNLTKKKEDREKEDRIIAKEIVRMAEGNRELAKRTRELSVGRIGAHDRTLKEVEDMIGTIESEIEALGEEHAKNSTDINSLIRELEDSMSKDPDSKDSQLRDLEVLKKESDSIYNKTHEAKVAEVVRLKREYKELQRKSEQHIRKQSEISSDPYGHATETVLGFHAEADGREDYDKSEKNEIERAVDTEVSIQEEYKNAQKELPEMEKYLAGVESKFGEFELRMRNAREEMEEMSRLFSDTLKRDDEGIIKERKDRLNKARNPSFLGRMFGKAPENIVMEEGNALQVLYNNKRKQIEQISANCTNVIVPIYHALTEDGRTGGLSEYAVANVVHIPTLERRKKMAEDNPDTFGIIKDKIQPVIDLANSIQDRRNRIMDDYNDIYSRKLPELIQSLKKELGNVFMGYVRSVEI